MLDSLKCGWVTLDRPTPCLRNRQVRRQETGFIHAHGVPRPLQSGSAQKQFRNRDLANTTPLPPAFGDRALALRNVLTKDLPETCLDRRAHVKQRKGRVSM